MPARPRPRTSPPGVRGSRRYSCCGRKATIAVAPLVARIDGSDAVFKMGMPLTSPPYLGLVVERAKRKHRGPEERGQCGYCRLSLITACTFWAQPAPEIEPRPPTFLGKPPPLADIRSLCAALPAWAVFWLGRLGGFHQFRAPSWLGLLSIQPALMVLGTGVPTSKRPTCPPRAGHTAQPPVGKTALAATSVSIPTA